MNFIIISPFPPFRGGISKETEVLCESLISHNHNVKVINFKRLYPAILFPGKTQFLDSGQFVNSINNKRIIDTISPFSWNSSYKEIIKEDIDCILFRYWHPILIPSFHFIFNKIKRYNEKIKMFCICDNIFPHEKSTFIDKFFVKNLLRKFDGIFTMSKNVTNIIKKEIPQINVKTVFLPIKNNFGKALHKDEALEKLNLKGRNIILFFGLIRNYKGLDILIKAFKQLLKKNNDYRLIIAGECYENKNKYFELINDEKIKECILWFDQYVSDDKINLFFSACDLVVLPYKKASQSGIIPIAYNYNKLVLASDIAGLNEYIVNKKSGYLFDSNNENSLCENIEKIFKNHDFVESDNFISKYKQQFSTNNLYDKIISFINNE